MTGFQNNQNSEFESLDRSHVHYSFVVVFMEGLGKLKSRGHTVTSK